MIVNDELDLLQFRLDYLAPVVDRVLIVEADRTFVGAPKPLHVHAALERFRTHAPRVAYLVVELPADAGSPWERENAQRDAAVAELLRLAGADDLVLIADVDEIPSQDGLARLRRHPEACLLSLTNCRHFANWELPGRVVHPLLSTVRDLEHTLRRASGVDDRRLPIRDGAGVHLSFVGGTAQVVAKLDAYSHQELNLAHVRDARFLEQCRRHGVAPDWSGLLECVPPRSNDVVDAAVRAFPGWEGPCAFPARWRRQAFSGWASVRRHPRLSRRPALLLWCDRFAVGWVPVGLAAYALRRRGQPRA